MCVWLYLPIGVLYKTWQAKINMWQRGWYSQKFVEHSFITPNEIQCLCFKMTINQTPWFNVAVKALKCLLNLQGTQMAPDTQVTCLQCQKFTSDPDASFYPHVLSLAPLYRGKSFSKLYNRLFLLREALVTTDDFLSGRDYLIQHISLHRCLTRTPVVTGDSGNAVVLLMRETFARTN